MIIYLWYGGFFSSFVLNYYVLLRSLVRQKSLEGGKVAHMSVGAREQAQGREKLRHLQVWAGKYSQERAGSLLTAHAETENA